MMQAGRGARSVHRTGVAGTSGGRRRSRL